VTDADTDTGTDADTGGRPDPDTDTDGAAEAESGLGAGPGTEAEAGSEDGTGAGGAAAEGETNAMPDGTPGVADAVGFGVEAGSMRDGAGISPGGQRRRERGAAAGCVPVRLSRCFPVAVAGAGLLLPQGFSRCRPQPG
jgi:hypothetical protein